MFDHLVTSRMADSSSQQAIRISYLKKSRGVSERQEKQCWKQSCGQVSAVVMKKKLPERLLEMFLGI